MKTFFALILISLLSACVSTKSTTVSKQKSKAVNVRQLSKTSNSWNGKPLPDYPEGRPEVTVLQITIPAGTKIPMHKHTVINAAVILQGELTVVSDKGEKLHLKSGESIVELVESWHYGINEGNEDVELIVFYAGVKGKEITIKQ